MRGAIRPDGAVFNIELALAAHGRFVGRVDAVSIVRMYVVEKCFVAPIGDRIGVSKILIVTRRAPDHIGAQIHVPVAEAGGVQRKPQPLFAFARQALCTPQCDFV